MGKTVEAVIFDLDGVIVSTDEYHYQAWQIMADDEGIPFNRQDNDRLRGVSRMDCVDIILERAGKRYTQAEKQRLAEGKNKTYVAALSRLGPKDFLDGAQAALGALKAQGLKLAIGSSSKNTPVILEKLGLTDFFDAVSDGNNITRSKPDPEVFLVAADMLAVNTSRCVVVEDSSAGIDAALNAGMRAIGVGAAARYKNADYGVDKIEEIPDIIHRMNRL